MSERGPGLFFGFLARIGLSLDSQHSDLKLRLRLLCDCTLLVQLPQWTASVALRIRTAFEATLRDIHSNQPH